MYDFVLSARMESNNEELKSPTRDESAKKVENLVIDDFYHENYILIIFMRLLGVMPISKNESGHLECKLTSPTSVYSILLFVIVSIGAGFALSTALRLLNNYNISFDDKITMYAAIVFMGFHLLPLIAFFEGKKIYRLFTSVKNFEFRYFQTTKQRLYFKMRKYQYLFLLILFILSPFFLYFLYFMLYTLKEKYDFDCTDLENAVTMVVFLHYLWIINAFVANWMFLTYGIRKIARILLKDIEDVRFRSAGFVDLYGLWLDLKNLTEDSGTAFSWTYLYFLSYMFLVVMGSSYSLFASIADPEASTKFAYLGLFIVCTFTFAVVGDCAHRTTAEVGEDFNNSILKLLSVERDPIMRREMKWFIQTMALHPPIITLSGYVTLNRGFNVSMLGTLVTYIVVVLQFRTTSYQPPLVLSTTVPSAMTTHH